MWTRRTCLVQERIFRLVVSPDRLCMHLCTQTLARSCTKLVSLQLERHSPRSQKKTKTKARNIYCDACLKRQRLAQDGPIAQVHRLGLVFHVASSRDCGLGFRLGSFLESEHVLCRFAGGTVVLLSSFECVTRCRRFRLVRDEAEWHTQHDEHVL